MTLFVLVVAALAALWLYSQESSAASSSSGASGGGFGSGGLGDLGNTSNNNSGAGQNFLSNLDNIAQAIFQYEGGNPGNRNVANNNPGNLRSGANMVGTSGGYAVFSDIGDGWDALNEWIQSHAAKNPDWDFYDMMNYYLTGSTTSPAQTNQGNSDSYAEYVANYVGVDPTTPVSSLLGYS